MIISRRKFLTSAGVAAGTLAASNVPFARTAFAQGIKQKATLVVYTTGGLNALFASAYAFLSSGAFSVSTGNVSDLGGGLQVDKAFFESLAGGSAEADAFCRQHFASVGIRHGASDHERAPTLAFNNATQTYPLALASAMGGSGPIKAASVGGSVPLVASNVGGVSMQRIGDMQPVITALKGGDSSEPIKSISAKAQRAAQGVSGTLTRGNPKSLLTLKNGQDALIQTLDRVGPAFDLATIPSAYGLSGTAVRGSDPMSLMAASELMIRAGTNVVVLYGEDGIRWDSHGDGSGTVARNLMNGITPAIGRFIQRMMVDPASQAQFDISIAFISEFARSETFNSNHASMTSAAVIGSRVKTGISGPVVLQGTNVTTNTGTPAYDGFWAYLAAMSGVTGIFGANPHATVTR